MPADLTPRLQALYDRFKSFPEIGHTPQGVIVRKDAFNAFLDARQLIEREVLPAAHQVDQGRREAALLLKRLRAASEHDVELALDGAYVSLPLRTPAEVLEAFNRILDVTVGDGKD